MLCTSPHLQQGFCPSIVINECFPGLMTLISNLSTKLGLEFCPSIVINRSFPFSYVSLITLPIQTNQFLVFIRAIFLYYSDLQVQSAPGCARTPIISCLFSVTIILFLVPLQQWIHQISLQGTSESMKIIYSTEKLKLNSGQTL